jgi:hypothetical protein
MHADKTNPINLFSHRYTQMNTDEYETPKGTSKFI